MAFLETANAQQVLWDHIGDGTTEVYLSRMAELGDIDGDGVGDFITSVGQFGFVEVESGADGSVIKRHSGTSPFGVYANFGAPAISLGDFNGDGTPDYAIGSNAYSTSAQALGAGRVLVYSGASHQPILDIHEGIAWEHFGASAIGLGDVNADGNPDLGVVANSGLYRVYLGPSGTLHRTHPNVFPSQEVSAPYGDYDGDGFDDYLVGQSAYSDIIWGAGRVFLFSGRTGEVLLTMHGTRRGIQAGLAVCRGGDWNGDGISEIVAAGAATWNFSITYYEAGVYVFNGADGSVLHFFDEKDYCSFNSALGFSIASDKDVNGDGVPDLIVGAPMDPWPPAPPTDIQRGSVFVISGATKSVLWKHTGEKGGDRAGVQVLLIDDHNGDGFADWMVGSPYYDADPINPTDIDEGRNTIYAGGPGDATPICSGGSNSVGSGARLWNSGPISVNQNELQLVVSNMPQATSVILIHGQASAPVPFGSGQLCIGGSLAVLSVLTTDSSGLPGSPASATTTLDLKASPFTDSGNTVQPGDTWAFQALYRDQDVRNTSNALDVVFVE